MWGNEFQGPVGESVALVNLETGCLDGGAGVAVEVTSPADCRPQRGDCVFDDAYQRVGRADVFEKPQLPTGLEHACQLGLDFLGQRRPLRTGQATYAQVVTSGRSTSRCSTVISPGQKSFRRFATSSAMTTER